MNIRCNEILKSIDSDFTRYYKTFSKFKDSGILWDECVSSVKNKELMNHMLFCNDKLQIPPVQVFMVVNKQFSNLSDSEKKSIGAFWGFVYKFVFGYNSQKSRVINTGGVKTATYFYGNPSEIMVIE